MDSDPSICIGILVVLYLGAHKNDQTQLWQIDSSIPWTVFDEHCAVYRSVAWREDTIGLDPASFESISCELYAHHHGPLLPNVRSFSLDCTSDAIVVGALRWLPPRMTRLELRLGAGVLSATLSHFLRNLDPSYFRALTTLMLQWDPANTDDAGRATVVDGLIAVFSGPMLTNITISMELAALAWVYLSFIPTVRILELLPAATRSADAVAQRLLNPGGFPALETLTVTASLDVCIRVLGCAAWAGELADVTVEVCAPLSDDDSEATVRPLKRNRHGDEDEGTEPAASPSLGALFAVLYRCRRLARLHIALPQPLPLALSGSEIRMAHAAWPVLEEVGLTQAPPDERPEAPERSESDWGRSHVNLETYASFDDPNGLQVYDEPYGQSGPATGQPWHHGLGRDRDLRGEHLVDGVWQQDSPRSSTIASRGSLCSRTRALQESLLEASTGGQSGLSERLLRDDAARPDPLGADFDSLRQLPMSSPNTAHGELARGHAPNDSGQGDEARTPSSYSGSDESRRFPYGIPIPPSDACEDARNAMDALRVWTLEEALNSIPLEFHDDEAAHDGDALGEDAESDYNRDLYGESFHPLEFASNHDIAVFTRSSETGASGGGNSSYSFDRMTSTQPLRIRPNSRSIEPPRAERSSPARPRTPLRQLFDAIDNVFRRRTPASDGSGWRGFLSAPRNRSSRL